MSTFLESRTGPAPRIASAAVRVDGERSPIAALRLIVAIAAVAIVLACGVLLWLMPWPVDAFAAVVAAAAWTSWIERQERA